ncbi:CvpA family protein [candidate division KSB1 bacterium]
MNYLDIIILAVVGFFLYRGVKKGLIKSFSGIFGFFVALIVATGLMGDFARVLQNVININKGVSYLLSYIILFFGVLIIFKIISNLIVKLFTVTSTRWVDRIGGGVFGFLLGGLIISSILVFLSFFSFTEKLLPETDGSFLYPAARGFAPSVYDLVVNMGPLSQKFQEITEDILKGQPAEVLRKSKAGRDLLDYWDKINSKAKEVIDKDDNLTALNDDLSGSPLQYLVVSHYPPQCTTHS